MGLSVEYSGLAVIHLIYKVVPLFAVMRWLLCWAFRYTMGRLCCFSQLPQPTSSTPPKYCSSVSAQMIHESLPVTTYDEDDIVFERSNSSSSITTTCAVCLNELKKGDVVKELRNCCHVFHRKCIDRWADNHHQYKTCPLCRAPLLLLPSTSTSTSTSTSPSWAVERLLYLFVMTSEEDSIEQAAVARRERLKALRVAQELMSNPDEGTAQELMSNPDEGTVQSEDKKDGAEEANEEETSLNMKFRNYLPHDKQLQEGKLAPPFLPKFEDPIAITNRPHEMTEDPFVNIAPKKPNWDLRRDVQKKLDKLERRTQKAIFQLMEEQEKQSQALAEGNGEAAVEMENS